MLTVADRKLKYVYYCRNNAYKLRRRSIKKMVTLIFRMDKTSVAQSRKPQKTRIKQTQTGFYFLSFILRNMSFYMAYTL